MSDSLNNLQQQVVAFRNARDWQQFHTIKNMLLSFGLELAELSEHFQWLREDEVQDYLSQQREGVGEELADLLYWLLLLSNDLGVDLPTAFAKKMKKNADKYPTEQVLGLADKGKAARKLQQRAVVEEL